MNFPPGPLILTLCVLSPPGLISSRPQSTKAPMLASGQGSLELPSMRPKLQILSSLGCFTMSSGGWSDSRRCWSTRQWSTSSLFSTGREEGWGFFFNLSEICTLVKRWGWWHGQWTLPWRRQPWDTWWESKSSPTPLTGNPGPSRLRRFPNSNVDSRVPLDRWLPQLS